jgi:cytochrome c peroxidase
MLQRPLISICLSLLLLAAPGRAADPNQPGAQHLLTNTKLQQLGDKLFFDTNLSRPQGQSCATCHAPEVGWSGPDDKVNRASGVYPGAVHSRFGNRKPTTAAYATLAPSLHLTEEGFVGGNFWDGRATGWKLSNPAADQAQGPFLNPVEQNGPNAAYIVRAACRGKYGGLLRQISSEIWDIENICKKKHTDTAYAVIALAIAAFEHSPRVNAFSSKYDLYLQGKAKLTPMEEQGRSLFEGKGKCSECHPSKPGPGGTPPLFTDFTYDNLGMPKNPDNPWYRMKRKFNPDGKKWVDPGLGGALKAIPQYAMLSREHWGKHRVPTLRNVDLRPQPGFVKAYGHNGFFKSLLSVVHFYNTRDTLGDCAKNKKPEPGVNCWPAPEVTENLNKEELGDLKLTKEEEQAIVTFMKTLSDGYQPE